MDNISINLTPAANKYRIWQLTSFLFYPTGLVRIWKGSHRLWIRLLYTLLGLPVFLILFGFLAITGFALFLPPLDLTVGNRTDRTIINKEGNYKTTFLKSGNETGGAYELLQVEVEPQGGNSWHYHKGFEEQFTVLKGIAVVGNNGKEYRLQEGDSTTAYRKQLHFFKNPTDSILLLRVKAWPAKGLEKSIRIAYGLGNDGQFKNGITKNKWHMALLLGYSGSFLPGIPGFIQEPLVTALAKIAQWKGEDKALEKYFR
jgi:quercetin dioxygenase-like cupin family protein